MDQPIGAKEFIELFTGILYEALPFIILGAIISGLLEELVPQSLVARILPRNRWLAIALGGLLGLIFPMCECGIIPVMRRLLRKGVPLSCCVCYMLAGPIINVVVMTSTLFAFSGTQSSKFNAEIAGSGQLGSLGITGLRVGLGYLVAFVASLVVERQWRVYGTGLMKPLVIPEPDAASEEVARMGPAPSVLQRINNIAETALHDFVDITVFLILGALLAVTTRVVMIQTKTLDRVNTYANRYPPLAIVIFMGLAIVLCLCSEADAFVAASFVEIPPSAKLAFLVLGPMLDFKLYLMFMRVFKPRLMWTIIISVLILVFVFANITHFALQRMPESWYQSLAGAEETVRWVFGGRN